MPIKVKRYYLDTIRMRYKNAPKSEKKRILDEFCFVCKYSRKYAIRVLNGRVEPRLSKPGPKARYGHQVVHHLKELWELMGYMCSKKMVVALPLWLEFSKGIEPEIKSLLMSLSASTIDRLLRPYKKSRGISSTRPSLIKSRIPLKLLDGEIKKPGFVEGDTVAHCGDTLLGQFVNSLTVTDLYSAWTENRALWTKSADQVLTQMKRIEDNLPFELLGFASDNGSEFLNETLAGHFHNRLRAVEFVRRRPYKKNDNAHVEQKNHTHVRELFGYQRFDHPDLVIMMNEIYQAFWNPLQNFFTPTLKLKEKIRVGSKIKKKYELPKTPYQRLIESPDLPNHLKRKLIKEFNCKNPFTLKAELDKRLKIFFETADRLKRQQYLLKS